LRFEDGTFDCVLAFGLYHNLLENLDLAVQETFRVLNSGGRVCASFRADNLQTRMTDWLAERRKGPAVGKKEFHKLNLTRAEFQSLFERAGFVVEFVGPVENMPILYKFRFFRAKGHKQFDENKARMEGYQLSWLGRGCQNFLMSYLPDQFCNIYVLIARKA
jgi:SAM-dependent methyltransferase